MRPFAHFRLAAYFAAVALATSLGGVVALDALAPAQAGPAAAVALCGSVWAACALGFLGVLFHRLRVDPIRWRETEQYLASIRRESAKYRTLMEGAADLILVVDPDGRTVRESNARARLRLGLSGEGRGAGVADLVAPQDLAAFEGALERARREPGSVVGLAEVRLAGAGRPLLAGASFAAIELEGERIVHVSLRDLTHEKELERQLQVRERLSSIGLLTAGVAHEINNPLEGIANYLALLERENLAPDARTRYLAAVRHGFERIRDHVRELLRFARPDAGRGEADLAGVVARALALVAYHDRFRGVEVELHGLDAPLAVVGDAGRLEQVVVNLLLNAANALGGRGRVTIRAERVPDPATRAPALELSVEDDGPGIPPELLERIFDPFFTTGPGTGLGLAVSYGIVRAHGGTLSAGNRAQGGARFVMRLPWPDATAPRAATRRGGG